MDITNEVVLQHNGEDIEVDISTRELGEELLKTGIPVLGISTDDLGNHFTIYIPSMDELSRLFEILFVADESSMDDSLFMRVFYPTTTPGIEWFPMLMPLHAPWDDYQTQLENGENKSPFFFAIRLNIVMSDYDEVLRRVKEHNK